MLCGHMLVLISGLAVRCEANVTIIEVEQKKNRTHTHEATFSHLKRKLSSQQCEKKKKTENLSMSSESHGRSHMGHFYSG